MSLKQRLRMADILTNNTKMGWNCDSNREKCKYNGKIPTATCPWNSDLGRQIWWQTTQRWVETATATQKSTNTIVKYQQWHVLETATWDGRYGDKHRDGLKLRQRQRTAQIQRWNTDRDLSSSSILEMAGCEIQTREYLTPLRGPLYRSGIEFELGTTKNKSGKWSGPTYSKFSTSLYS